MAVQHSTDEVERLAHPTHLNTAQRIASDYDQLSTWIGLFGNTCFFVGSALFLWETTQTPAIWLFILGSLGMLVDSVAGALRRSIDKRSDDGTSG